MSTGSKFRPCAGVVFLCAALGAGTLQATDTDTASSHPQHHKKTTPKKPDLPPLASGPTGRPVPQMPLDSIKPIAPTVTFDKGELTIVAPNSTLGDILRAVRKQTGAEIEIPEAQDRVVTHLGPGPARAIVAELLNGSRFNYVLLGSPQDANVLTRVVLVAKSGPDNPAPAAGTPAAQAAVAPPAPENQDTNDAEAMEDSSTPDDNAAAEQLQQQQAAEAEQQPAADQNGVKTPQQMLQEMQQRQMQFQQQIQQQQGGTPQQPGAGYPQRPTLPGQQPQQPPDQNQNQ